MGFRSLVFLLLCIQEVLYKSRGNLVILENKDYIEDSPLLPEIPPSGSPQPLLPLLAPAPLSPFFNNSTPKLSGQCSLNFTSVDNLITTTAIDCLASFAPFLANVICCPQVDATLSILIGQSSKQSGSLSLDPAHATHCLSDLQSLLLSRGAADNLKFLCEIHQSNLTDNLCPITDVNTFESLVDSAELLERCRRVDPVNECCSRVCQGAISEAAKKLAGSGVSGSGSGRMESCKGIVFRWLASRIEPDEAKQMLRQISNCNVNGACPLEFPDTGKVAKECGQKIKNQTNCCRAMDSYVSHLQKQSFITNLQALDCASVLGTKLQNMKVTENIYELCQITLKDFSLQVGSQESGCLLPSMPSDATFDPSSGISFTCDLNDNIAAPWPTRSLASPSSCNKSVNLPALPAATSTQNGGSEINAKTSFITTLFMIIQLLLLQA